MYEKRKEPLAPSHVFWKRIGKNIVFTTITILLSLAMGTAGYHYFATQSWIDSFHNASMILSGMGPVITITSDTGKIFSSFFALFSGLIIVTNMGILLAPVMHRIYHMMHIEED
jgi:hypothetical protein